MFEVQLLGRQVVGPEAAVRDIVLELVRIGRAPADRAGVFAAKARQRADAGPALEAARRADAAGVDGVFCYDHVWPLGQPHRPALAPFPLLAAVARSTERVCLGPLVARVGLVPDQVLLSQVDALAVLAPGRVVMGLGTGDRLSAGENEAYGVAYAPAGERRASLRACVRAVLDRGIPAWVGDGAPRTLAGAEGEGAAGNVWGARPEGEADQAGGGEVTWAGPSPAGRPLAPLVEGLARAGATWVVLGWPVDLDELAAGSVNAGWVNAGSSGGEGGAGDRPGGDVRGR